MTGACPDNTKWSRRQFWRAAAAILAGQILIVFCLGERPLKAKSPLVEPIAFHFVLHEAKGQQLLDTFLASDPTVFILPHERGFSGRAWIKEQAVDYQLPEWNEPPRWLTLNMESLGQNFVQNARDRATDSVMIAEKLTSLSRKETTSVPRFIKKDKPSTFRIEGELSHRLSVQAVTLPSWEHTEPVPETIIDIAVDAAGRVVSSRLAPRRAGDVSPLPAADEKGLEIARGLRFQPVNSGQLTWGKLILLWQTTPALATNRAGGAIIEP